MNVIQDEINSIRTGVGITRRSQTKTLKLSGPDRIRFLNGMVTNDVRKVTDTRGLWAIKTNNRGRIEGLLRIRRAEDALYLDVDASVSTRVLTVLDQFIIMDDCVIEDVSDQSSVLTLIGPKSAQVLAENGFELPSENMVDAAIAHNETGIVIADRSFGPWGFELHLNHEAADSLVDSLLKSGLSLSSDEALETLRIESGCVRNAIDLDEDTIPMEARLEYAIDFEKGCYVGQEVIARATNLGQVNYLLVGLRFEAEAHDDQFKVQWDDSELLVPDSDKVVGELNSVTYSPQLNAKIGLGYVHRKYETVGTKLTCRVRKDVSKTASLSVELLPFIEFEAIF
jgi:folate-binding protein YgfZ